MFLVGIDSMVHSWYSSSKGGIMEGKSNILIVDDEEMMRDVISRSLKNCGKYNIFVEENGERALNLLRDNSDIDTILLDVLMPVMGAQEFLPALAGIKYEKELHVVIMSGFLGNVNLSDLIIPRPGIRYSFLAKPFNQLQLKETLQLT